MGDLMKNKTIGVLGGMGPEATAKMYKDMIELCQEKYGAVQDNDLVYKQLISGIKKLEAFGADVIVIACNTVHYFIDEMRANVKIPILSMIDESVKKIQHDCHKKVALFASETTLNYGLYVDGMLSKGISLILPKQEDYKIMTNAILFVMSGKNKNKEFIELVNQSEADVILLGCTELPLAISESDTSKKLYDSSKILAEAVLDFLNK